jgi:hypothetical protein
VVSAFSGILFLKGARGKESDFNWLAISKTNDWSGSRVTWGEAVIPVLIDYFESTAEAYKQRHGKPLCEVLASSPDLSKG